MNFDFFRPSGVIIRDITPVGAKKIKIRSNLVKTLLDEKNWHHTVTHVLNDLNAIS